MTKGDRELVGRAIDLLLTDDGWEEGMVTLCRLAGRSTVRYDEWAKAESVPFTLHPPIGPGDEVE